MKIFFLSIFLISINIVAFPTDAFAFGSLRCGSKIVSEGAHKIEVLKSCGSPTFIEKWRKKRLFSDKRRRHRKLHFKRFVEEWTYNFGPNKFIQFLTFSNGKLVDIVSGPYGFDEELPLGSQKSGCGKMLSTGDKKIEVLMKCGEPSFKDILQELGVDGSHIEENRRFIEQEFFVDEEEWTYNFGPNEFLLFVTLRKGKIIGIEHGDYGFN